MRLLALPRLPERPRPRPPIYLRTRIRRLLVRLGCATEEPAEGVPLRQHRQGGGIRRALVQRRDGSRHRLGEPVVVHRPAQVEVHQAAAFRRGHQPRTVPRELRIGDHSAERIHSLQLSPASHVVDLELAGSRREQSVTLWPELQIEYVPGVPGEPLRHRP